MQAYSEFASVYDLFMEDTPYEDWLEFIKQCFTKYQVKPQTACELGCGTGKMTSLLAQSGMEVIGIDLAADMLMLAQDHALQENLNILYILQDMSEFELNEPVDFICSCCDSMNYLLEEEELLSTLNKIYDFLKPNGLCIFDMNTTYKYKEILGNQIFADQTETAAYIWENYYDEEEEINEYEVSFFIQDEKGKYDRSIENHYQRAYSLEKVQQLIGSARLELLDIYDNYSFSSVNKETQRATFVIRRS